MRREVIESGESEERVRGSMCRPGGSFVSELNAPRETHSKGLSKEFHGAKGRDSDSGPELTHLKCAKDVDSRKHQMPSST